MTTPETVILGANRNLDFLLPIPDRGAPDYAARIMVDLLNLVDMRLKFRFIFSTLQSRSQAAFGNLAALADAWYDLGRYDGVSEFTFATHKPSVGLALADNERAVVIESVTSEMDLRINIIESSSEVGPIQNYFDHLWRANEVPKSRSQILYEDLLLSSFPETTSEIVTVSKAQWSRVLEELNRDPTSIFGMSSFEFEQLIAHLLDSQGYSVTLTKQTRDGGKDILVATPTALGDLLYLIECKKYSPQNPVGVSLVRELYGVVERERATAGVLVTSSNFTTDALKFREPISHRLTLHDYTKLQEWIRQAVSRVR
jgi:HJR/Mrr/RecB family endonuclease